MTIHKMLSELVALGQSQRAIARGCGTSQPNIQRALAGAEPRYLLGKAIEKYHKKSMRSAARKAAA